MDGRDPVEVDAIDYPRIFPWVHLFRGFRIAVDPRKVLLATAGLLLLAAGNWAFGFLPFAPDESAVRVPLWPHAGSAGGGAAIPLRASELLAEEPQSFLLSAASHWGLVLQPVWTLLEPALLLFQTGTSWSAAAYAWTRLIWALVVWALIGGAITRMAAVQFAREERIGLSGAIQFAGGKFLSYLGAPLPAVAGLLVLWLLCVLGGLIGRIPGAGPVVVGLFYFVPLLLAFAMAFLILVLAFGWPLMLAAISTEGSDAFDGLSRASSYVLSRPWHYLWSAIVAMVYGAIVILFVALFVAAVIYLAGWAVAGGMGMNGVSELYRLAPGLAGQAAPFAAPLSDDPTWGARFAGFWLSGVSLLVAGFVYSYFWTASTIIYFLLRRSEDAADFDEVFLPETDPADDLLPLVGVAASDQPVIERPVTREDAAAEPATDGADEPAPRSE